MPVQRRTAVLSAAVLAGGVGVAATAAVATGSDAAATSAGPGRTAAPPVVTLRPPVAGAPPVRALRIAAPAGLRRSTALGRTAPAVRVSRGDAAILPGPLVTPGRTLAALNRAAAIAALPARVAQVPVTTRALPAALRPALITPCLPAARRGPQAKVPDPKLLAAFGVLRRPRAASDALSAEARRELVRQGVAVTDDAVRLLRTTPAGGKAWIVPVADASACPSAVFPFAAPAVRALVPQDRRALPAPRTFPLPPRTTRRARPTAPAPAPLTPAAPVVPAAPVPAPPASTRPRTSRPATRARPAAVLPETTPRPGVLVVATGDAAGGAGGPLSALVRGLAPVEVQPCAGPDGDLLSVSGLVPDGVAFVHLTRTDGTAVRADVKDNAYAFLVRPDDAPGETYVTWTGGDGTPHVQPVGAPLFECLPVPPRVSP